MTKNSESHCETVRVERSVFPAQKLLVWLYSFSYYLLKSSSCGCVPFPTPCSKAPRVAVSSFLFPAQKLLVWLCSLSREVCISCSKAPRVAVSPFLLPVPAQELLVWLCSLSYSLHKSSLCGCVPFPFPAHKLLVWLCSLHIFFFQNNLLLHGHFQGSLGLNANISHNSLLPACQ